MAKLERKMKMFFAGFLQAASADVTSPTAPTNVDWEVLGIDTDDLSKEMNPDTETSKNVLGESTFKHNGYEPEISVEPFYAYSDSELYRHLKDIAEKEQYGDAEITGYFVEATYETATDTNLTGTGQMREAKFVVNSVGGDTSGLGIDFSIYPVGPMKEVTVSYVVATRSPTIALKT